MAGAVTRQIHLWLQLDCHDQQLEMLLDEHEEGMADTQVQLEEGKRHMVDTKTTYQAQQKTGSEQRISADNHLSITHVGLRVEIE